MTIYTTEGASPGVLTYEKLVAAIEKVKETARRPHQHVVHPNALKRDGWYLCDCGPLYIVGGRVSAPPTGAC